MDSNFAAPGIQELRDCQVFVHRNVLMGHLLPSGALDDSVSASEGTIGAAPCIKHGVVIGLSSS